MTTLSTPPRAAELVAAPTQRMALHRSAPDFYRAMMPAWTCYAPEEA